MAHPVRGAPKEMSAGCGCEGEDVGLEDGVGARLRVRESSVQDVTNHQREAEDAKYDCGRLGGWAWESALPFVGGSGHF